MWRFAEALNDNSRLVDGEPTQTACSGAPVLAPGTALPSIALEIDGDWSASMAAAVACSLASLACRAFAVASINLLRLRALLRGTLGSNGDTDTMLPSISAGDGAVAISGACAPVRIIVSTHHHT